MKRVLEISIGVFLVVAGVCLWWRNGGGFDFGFPSIALVMFLAGGAAFLFEGVKASRRYAIPILIGLIVLALLFVTQPAFFVDFIVNMLT